LHSRRSVMDAGLHYFEMTRTISKHLLE